MKSKNVFILYACCQLVKGASRTLICDLQRNKYHFIPNSLYHILTEDKRISLDILKVKYPKNIDTIEEYFQFLIDEDLGFFCPESELNEFPDLDLAWKNPSDITNAIIDVDNTTEIDSLKLVLQQLDILKCSSVQVRIFTDLANEVITRISKYFENSRIRSVDIILKYDESKSVSFFKYLVESNQRIFSFIIHSSPFEDIIDIKGWNSQCIYTQKVIDSPLCCGVTNPNYFTVNLPFFTESQNHNTCLNRKISIDTSGNIKNCPSMVKSYGNIKDTQLSDVLVKPNFKDLWLINKDKIEVCKDCEFRHICIDCRAILQNPDNIYSKPSKCKYNPYEAIWEE